MAKMFYTLEEAAQKLGKSEDELREMAERGEIQEFRDGDRLMFKRDQIDLLTDDDGSGDTDDGGDEILGLADSGELEPMSLSSSESSSGIDLGGDSTGGASGIDLADSAAGGQSGSMIGLADSGMLDEPTIDPAPDADDDADTGSGSSSDLDMGFDESSDDITGDLAGNSGSAGLSGDTGEGTGISIFDADDTEDVDPAAQTNVEAEIETPEFAMDSGGSGSGLLDLTRESDDTSLGADLLDDVYGGDSSDDAADETMPAGQDSSLFESTPETEGDLDRPDLVPAQAEVYDPKGSLGVGLLAFAVLIAMIGSLLVIVLAQISGSAGMVAGQIADIGGFNIAAGAVGGAALLLALIGMVIAMLPGKK